MKKWLFFFSLMALAFLVVPQACADPPDAGQTIISFCADHTPAMSFHQAQLPEVVLLEYDSPGLFVPIMAADSVLDLCIVYLDAIPHPPDKAMAILMTNKLSASDSQKYLSVFTEHYDPGWLLS